MAKRNWVSVDLDGLRKILQRRGIEFILFELIQNAWDEDVTKVDVQFTWQDGLACVVCTDDSPEGFRDMASTYTMYRESYKKDDASKRGRFEAGEKFVLALCEEATITSTKGTVHFNKDGSRSTTRTKTERGSIFEASIKMTKKDFEYICSKVELLIPPVPTFFNGEALHGRSPLAKFEESLPTVVASPDGILLPAKRKTEVKIYEPHPGETAMLYEMGIPVVETEDKWHVDVQQKVPLNIERDNVTPGYLRRIRVAVLNRMADKLTEDDATTTWVKEAASDPYVQPAAFTTVMDLRYGENRVAFDPSDIGSNREAASQDYTVVTGGSMSKGEWENARKSGAIQPAGQLFPTNLSGKVPAKVYSPDEYTDEMTACVKLVQHVAPKLIGYDVKLSFIKDKDIVAGCYNHTAKVVTINLAHISLTGHPSQAFLDVLIHELAHDTVQSNDHLHRDFYTTCTRLGAQMTRLALTHPEWFS